MQAPIYITQKKRATTLALFTIGAIDPNSRVIWAGTTAAAKEAGVNLICYPGRLVSSPVEYEAQRNVIYNMVDAQTVDGLVILGGLTTWVDSRETYTFLKKLSPRPVVTTGIILDGIPGVSVDNYHSMYEVINHIVTVHNRRRIAFICGQAGHQEAIDRYQAYQDVLRDNDIPFDPNLVYQGNFKESGGVEGVKALLDERQVRFDSLIAASDNMAIGAIKTLQARGLRVPADIAVTGMNGEDQGLVINPPLTTALLHFFEQGYQATKMVLSMLDGQVVPSRVILPTRLVIRQSCGCPDPLVTHAAETTFYTQNHETIKNETADLEKLIFEDSDSPLVESSNEKIRQIFPMLLKTFLDESQGKSDGQFLNLFTEALQKTIQTNDDFSPWHEIISFLRLFAISKITDPNSRLRIENLMQQGRVVLGESSRRYNAFKKLKADEKLHILGEINQSLSVITSIAELTDVLEKSLPMLSISRCFLFLYENPDEPDQFVQFIFGYENNQRTHAELEKIIFPTHQLLPVGLLTTDQPYNLVVEPLFFRDDQLGYVIFEADPNEEAIYEILGGQISASLKRTILTEHNIRLFDEAVEARKAADEANLLKSHFLSMVSHELRTPLALIVGTIEMMSQEEKSGIGEPMPQAYQKDISSIQNSAKHLFRLIGDVLDLASNQAGELRLTLEPLNLSNLFSEVASLGQSMAREKGLEWRESIPAEQHSVRGDFTRLRQVMLNLLSNAVKFTKQGFVSMTVRYEDNNVLVEVSDTGMGIPLEEQELIFDEFRRSERSVARGFGGMGLGLAITRRLIELHGGKIGVHSIGVEEGGSTFYFSLPLMVEPAGDAKPSSCRKKSVLILSENSSPKIRQHLQNKGFVVEMMDISKQTDWLARINSQSPGALVLDFQPANEHGWEMIQQLKQNEETRDIPVIFFSLPDGSDQGSILAMDYLAKPIGSAELSQALERLGLKTEDNIQKILVVDDDPKILELHVRMLESQTRCSILKADGGKSALEIIKRENLALVLLDLMMPEVDGFEVLRIMREQDSTRNIPVIVLSAQILTEHDIQRLQDGVSAVLNKGMFSMNEVLAQVEAVLNHSKSLGSPASRMVRQVMAYIHEHYEDSITRVDLARHVSITERYLTYCFHQEMGITPMVYLNRYRVKRAKMLLEKGKLNITEVAQQVGFSDGSYFNRVFRQEVGVTPGAYMQGKRLKKEK